MLKSLSRLAIGRGIGGSRAWLIIGITATGLRVFAKMVRKEPEIVYCEPIEPGHRLVISHLMRDDA